MSQSLDDLPLADGLRLGHWHVWRSGRMYDGCDDLFFCHQVRPWIVRTPIPLGGWIDYRSALNRWHTCFGSGRVREDSGHDDILHWLDQTMPADEWTRTGTFGAGDWMYDVFFDRLLIRHANNGVPIVLYRDRLLWTRDKKPLPGCEG